MNDNKVAQAFAIALALVCSAILIFALSIEPGNSYNNDEVVLHYGEAKGWQTVVRTQPDGKVNSCTTFKHISDTLMVEVDYYGGTPALRVVGANFPLDNPGRALIQIDNDAPVQLFALREGSSGWRTRFNLPSDTALFGRLKSGAVAHIYASGRVLDMPLDGTATAFDQLADCFMYGQEFVDRRLIRKADKVIQYAGGEDGTF